MVCCACMCRLCVGVCFTYLKQYKEALEALDHANSLHRHDATTMQARAHILISMERRHLLIKDTAGEGSVAITTRQGSSAGGGGEGEALGTR